MPIEPDDFGPTLVTASQIQAWFSRWSRRSSREASAVSPAAHAAAADVPSPQIAASAQSASRPSPAPRAGGLSLAGPARPLLSLHSIVAVFVMSLLVWLGSGFYKVQPDQKGLVLRFGRWIDTRSPGLNWHLPYPIDFVLLPKVTAINQLKIGNGAPMQMLTGDENIVEATASISWRIKDPAKFLFSVIDPEGTVKVAGESAVRQIIGLNPIQSGLSDQRQKIADDAQALLQRLLDSYDSGIEITQVQMQSVDPPLAGIDAFNDVQRARADQQRARNEAEAYRNDILPRARAEADRVSQDAQAYKEQVLNQAHSDASRFLAFAASYADAPEVTRRRLYLETMEDVLKSAGKILIDPSGRAGPSIVPYLSLGVPPQPAPASPPASPKVAP